jgi:endonuclease-3
MALKKNHKRIKAIIGILDREYPKARTALNFNNPLQLLIATILSAQCTDERVNSVTASLFKKYKTAKDLAQADLHELEGDIRPTGFYKNKAQGIKRCCADIVSRYKGSIPDNLEDMVTLSGVGRKTANMVLGNAFGIPGIVVDTHVNRVSQRIGLTKNNDPNKIEIDLMGLVPQHKWIDFSHQLILLGRYICTARKPQCPICHIQPHCDFGQKSLKS